MLQECESWVRDRTREGRRRSGGGGGGGQKEKKGGDLEKRFAFRNNEMKEREREKGKDGGSGGCSEREVQRRRRRWKKTKRRKMTVKGNKDRRDTGLQNGWLQSVWFKDKQRDAFFFHWNSCYRNKAKKTCWIFFKGIFCPSVKQIIQIVSLEVCELVLSWNKKRTLCILSSQWQLGVHRCCLAVRMSLYLLPLFASWFLRQIWFFQRFGMLWRTFTSTEWNVLPWSLTPS